MGHVSPSVPRGSTTYRVRVLVEPHTPRLRLQLVEGALFLRARAGRSPASRGGAAGGSTATAAAPTAADAEKETQPDHQRPEPGAPQQAVQPPEPRLRLGFGATELVDNPPVHLLHSGVDDRQPVVHDGVPPLVARPVLRRPGDHARRVLVLELQRVGDGRQAVQVGVRPARGPRPGRSGSAGPPGAVSAGAAPPATPASGSCDADPS